MIIGEGLTLSLTGLALGLVGAWWLGRAGSSLLFGVTASDPLTFTTVSLLLTAVATAACYFPARRAMAVDPMVAIRDQPESVWQAARQKVERAVRHLSADGRAARRAAWDPDRRVRGLGSPGGVRSGGCGRVPRDSTGTDRRVVHHAAREGRWRVPEQDLLDSGPRGPAEPPSAIPAPARAVGGLLRHVAAMGAGIQAGTCRRDRRTRVNRSPDGGSAAHEGRTRRRAPAGTSNRS